MNAVTPLFLLAALVAAPIGLRLADPGEGAARYPHRLARMAALPAAALLVVALRLAAGTPAVLLALPWFAMGCLAALASLMRLADGTDGGRSLPPPNPRLALDAATAYLLVGCAFLVADRAGLAPFGIGQPVVQLTAVHFTVAGFVLVVVGATTWDRVRARWVGAALGSVVAGMPVTALGFLGVPPLGVVGAVLVAAGGFGLGMAQLVAARRVAPRAPRLLIALGGVALVGSMPLAAAYAVGPVFGIGGPTLDLMARVHGSLNVLGFALPAAIGWRAATPAVRHVAPDLPDGRLAIAAAGIALVFAVLLTAFMAMQPFRPPNAPVPRWLVVGALLSLPGVVGLIGALRRRRAVIVAAGLVCLGQAFLAFSLVTIPFLIPAVVLLSIGIAGANVSGRGAIVGFGIVVLGICGWSGALGMTETICWQTGTGSGCASGEITVAGAAVVAIAYLAAIALALVVPGAPGRAVEATAAGPSSSS